MRPPVVLSLTYSLFAPLLFAADSGALATVPDRVTAVAIIHEMNLARQNRRFTRRSSNKRARITPVIFVYCRATFACAHTKAFALSTKRYNFCGARSRNQTRFRPVYVWLLLIIVVSRLAVQRDITAAMAAIPEIGSIVMAW